MNGLIPIIVWCSVIAVAALAALVHINRLRFQERVRSDARQRLSSPAPAREVDPLSAQELPPPVQRYLLLAVRERTRSVRTVRLRHGGRFRSRPEGSWLPIRGEQYVACDPPGFLWWGRVRSGPGVWFDARDQVTDGRGSLVVRLQSTLTVVDATGPGVDQGEMLRLLGEMVWYPTAFLDDRFVTWEELDERSARATLRQQDREVRAGFHFRRDGLPRMVTAQRYRDTRSGPVLTPWSGRFDDYRLVDGLMVPLQVEARWHLESGDWPYAQFKVERIEYDREDAF